MNRSACLARVISAALICRRHSAYRASPAVSRQIKEAALRLFKTKGIRKTTVAELAESVGIAKGTFYNFYATKGQLVAEIMENFDAASERELRNKIGGRDKIPIAEFYKYYVELFRPDTAFSFHFTPDDITAMQEMEETRRFFSQEHAVKTTKLVLEYVDGVREDVDYVYIANFAKLVNLSIENRGAFCQEAFEKNLRTYTELFEETCVEDGQFTVSSPISDRDITALESEFNVILERQRFRNISYGETTVRLFADTQKTNKAVILEGEPLSGDNCVLLTYNYAKAQGLSVGDSITLAGSGFVISGLCLKPNYAAMYADFEDSFPNSADFGIALITGNAMESLALSARKLKKIDMVECLKEERE